MMDDHGMDMDMGGEDEGMGQEQPDMNGDAGQVEQEQPLKQTF